MIEKVYSKVNPDKLLHFVHRLHGNHGRENLISEENYLQCSFMGFKKGTTFNPHKHIEKNRCFEKIIAQESWLVIKEKLSVYSMT